MVKPQRITIAGLLSFVLTVFLLQFWQHSSYPDSLWIVLCIFLLFGILGLLEEGTRECAAMTLSVSLGIALALTAVTRVTHVESPYTVDTYADSREVVLHGRIADFPDKRPLQTKYIVTTDWLRSAETQGKVEVSGNVLATQWSDWPKLHYGDEVLVRGKLQKPQPFIASQSSSQTTFPYDRYLSRFGVYSIMPRATFEYRRSTEERTLRTWLYLSKERFEESIDHIFPEPHGSFLAGLLTGSRRGIPQHLTESFNRTGLTHILAISGYNITIVMAVISGLLFFLPKKWQFLPAITGTILFTVIVGAEASVVRAAIMGILGLIALQLGRQKDMRMAILWTLAMMLLWNPKQLWYDASFQLSFLAVLGITELHPYLRAWLPIIPRKLNLREAFEVTIAAQLFAVPWAVKMFGTFSLIAPLANVLVAPFIPLAMLIGALGVSVSFLSFSLGQAISYIAWGFLEAIILIAKTLGSLPFASLKLPPIGAISITLYYTLLLAFLLTLRRKHSLVLPSP